ncbi:thiamine biosynthesis protein ThiS [Bacteroides coprosuis DSM 18011]|uniref:Thiamine biosynthesis protein ThiS n=1 Tax=Bacteroides coprosuis DSM 18011 TaxID=679937 RepID=F3ZQ55_9BACE|nr:MULTISPECIES: sulfur carrier protein ThiS [Bacteroides]EGJ71721.1 thiamine biosynthesis protein ThiS [Bacteroides coprosuis DSM 18011]HJD91471.1 sulfur carrier protein ThiS [Bacteroides coprosuis]
MKIILNNKPVEVKEGSSLSDLASQLNLPAQGIAIAIDYKVIPRNMWVNTKLEEDLELMVIEAVSGG